MCPGGFPETSGEPPGPASTQVHRVLHTGVEALPTHRVMNVRGVAREQHTPFAVGRRLPGHVGEPGDPGRAVRPEVRPVGDGERLTEILQGGLAGVFDELFGQDDPVRLSALRRVYGTDATTLAAHAEHRLLVHLDLGDQVAGCRTPPGEPDAGRLADQAASSVAPDEVFRPQRPAV